MGKKMREFYTVSDLLDPKLQRKRIAEEKTAADEYDVATGTNQLDRDSAQLELFVKRRELFRDYMANAVTPNDRAAYADQIARMDALIDGELVRMGLAE